MQASAWMSVCRTVGVVGVGGASRGMRMMSSSANSKERMKAKRPAENLKNKKSAESENRGFEFPLSVPVFHGEGGVVESNTRTVYVEGGNMVGLGGVIFAAEALNAMFEGNREPQPTPGIPPLVSAALKRGYVGQKYKQITGAGGAPSVIELDNMVFIVKREHE